MKIIGYTTTCLSKWKEFLPLEIVIEFIQNSGANAIELSLWRPKELLNVDFSRLTDRLKNFKYISVHAPFKEIIYGDNDLTYSILDKLKEAKEKLGVTNFILHPNLVRSFDVLLESGLDFLIENGIEDHGGRLEELAGLKEKYNFSFAFDIQHAYEHDPSILYALKFIEVLGNDIKEIHLSGYNDLTNHALVCQSLNQDKILQILNKKYDVPVILEGKIPDSNIELMKKELEFIRSMVNK